MQPDLFESSSQEDMKRQAPLARRVAPRTLDEIAGQENILGPGKILRRAIEADRITSLILYGPPGSGKTALARVIAMRTRAAFEPLNAVMSGVKELRELINGARVRQSRDGRKTIIFVDEIHRFNRAQQDALLPSVENGQIILIGATTENPFFSVVGPLLSRSQVFELQPLGEEQIVALLRRALGHPNRGFEDMEVQADEEALRHIAVYCEGDARRALNALEIAMLTTPPADNVIHITAEVAAECIQRKLLHYEGTGDEHYDAASAFIKSMRGTNPDAALYWMARMLEAGETPRFVARRICICASEDVGNADPMAIVLATAAWQACEFIGMPEAQIILAQAATYVASAPKSNAAYLGIAAAVEDVRQKKTIPVPSHLRDTHYPGARRLKRGEGYAYAHDYEDAFAAQDYGVPIGTYYHPNDRGKEAEFKQRLDAFKRRMQEAGIEPAEEDPPSP